VDSLYTVLPFLGGTWIPLDIPPSHEYEWWAKDQKEPILRIRTNEIGGNETITTIEYRDMYLGLDAGLDELNAQIKTFPNPVSDALNIQSNLPLEFLEILTLEGKKIQTFPCHGSMVYSIDCSLLSAGTYLLNVDFGSKRTQRLFVKQ
jgi:hypothetical protein